MRRLAAVVLLAAAGASPAAARVFPGPGPPAPRTTSEIQTLLRLGLPVYCGGRHTHDIALTFDDGPGPYTALVLHILHRSRVRATFFVVGKNIVGQPQLLPRELRAGGLGDHTWTHSFLPRLPPERVKAELVRTRALIERVAHTRVLFFRPPYGAHSPRIDRIAHRLGLIEVLWDVDSRDSEGAKWRAIARNIATEIRPGSIVLMHENRGQTVRALRFLVLPALRRRGLRPVSLRQLLTADPPTLRQLREGARGCFATAVTDGS